MERDKQIGASLKLKRKEKGMSRTSLSHKSGVSVHTITRYEEGHSINDDSRGKILLAMGMRESLHTVREEEKLINYKGLSIEELRSCLLVCGDFIREGTEFEKIQFVGYKNLIKSELSTRIKNLFS